MSKKITFNNVEYKSITDFYKKNNEIFEVRLDLFMSRIRNGVPIEQALKKQADKRKEGLDVITENKYKKYLIDNQHKKNTEIAEHLNLSRERIRQLRNRYNLPKVGAPNKKIINEILAKIRNGESTLSSPLPAKFFINLGVGKTRFMRWVEDDPNLKVEINILWKKSVKKKTNYKQKKCVQCKEIKILGDFYPSKAARTIDGRARRCKKCVKEKVEYYYIQRNIQEPTVEFQICRICRKNKEYFEFYRSTKNLSGLQLTCITCNDKYSVLNNF